MKKVLFRIGLSLCLSPLSVYAAYGSANGQVGTILAVSENSGWGAGFDGYTWISLKGVTSAGNCPVHAKSGLVRFFIGPNDDHLIALATSAKLASLELWVDWDDSIKQTTGECIARDVYIK